MIFVQVPVLKPSFGLICVEKIYIRYFALRNEADDYLGCLEVTQDVTPIQSLEGQKRLLD